MFLVAGAISLTPGGAVEGGQYYSNPIGSPTRHYNQPQGPIIPPGFPSGSYTDL